VIALITPPTVQQRESAWRASLDRAIGLHSEEYLAMVARGIAAKKRLLIGMRPYVQRRHALVPAGPLIVTTPTRESDPGRCPSLPLGHRVVRPRAARGSDVVA